MNGKKLLAGKFRDRNQFWIDGNVHICKDNGATVSREITIQNGEITRSACEDHLDIKSELKT